MKQTWGTLFLITLLATGFISLNDSSVWSPVSQAYRDWQRHKAKLVERRRRNRKLNRRRGR